MVNPDFGRYRSLQIRSKDDMAADARAIHHVMSDRLPPSEDWLLLRYIKLSTCSTMLPSTVVLDGCAPEPVFWILVFGQERCKPNIEAALLKLDRHRTASRVDGTKEGVSST